MFLRRVSFSRALPRRSFLRPIGHPYGDRRGLTGLCLALIFLLSSTAEAQSPQLSREPRWPVIVGTETGLFGISRFRESVPLWTGGAVRKIIRTDQSWILLTDQGILVSGDLGRWENRSSGIPIKTIKLYRGEEKSFITIVQEIKDLEINPQNPEILVCATKESVYLTRNGGRSWTDLRMPAYRTNGIKAVGVANLPELTVLVSHSVYGIHYIHPDSPQAKWAELSEGIEPLETTGNPDEVSDIAVSIRSGGEPVIYAAQTFRRRLYRLDWKGKRFIPLWPAQTAPSGSGASGTGRDGSASLGVGTIDSLDIGREMIRFVQDGGIMEINRPDLHQETPSAPVRPELLVPRARLDIRNTLDALVGQGLDPSCVGIWQPALASEGEFISLSELWLLRGSRGEAGAVGGVPGSPGRTTGPTGPINSTGPVGQRPGSGGGALGRRGLYFPTNHAQDPKTFQTYLDLLADRNLDMVVIDMKDDYGRLRFTPQNPRLAEKGRVFRPLDIDEFLKTMKSRRIYTVARIVVFKDPELAKKESGKYAVWDRRNNKPWAGYYDSRLRKSEAATRANPALETQIFPSNDPEYVILRSYYDEKWVDPYSEEVWEYIAEVSRELHSRGFDEIQFDYIRFPTDGENLRDAQYRWQDPGMDMESAILSFLRHIRFRVSAPLSIDIYGANGWYRTGARTGQEVELLAPYVDVICPMYYPSHFEQDFLAQSPPELRPYRIYYLGTERTARIARGRIIVRPYVQAFYLNVSYDRKYYDLDYVRREIEGVRDAGGPGYTYWNNSGRYADIPKPGG